MSIDKINALFYYAKLSKHAYEVMKMVDNAMSKNMFIEKENERHRREMARIDRAFKISIIPGIVAMLIFAAYFAVLPSESSHTISIPTAISKFIETDPFDDGFGSYETAYSAPFKTRPVKNLSYFENNRMDRIFATSKYDIKQNKAWLLIRGIKYNDLPYIYDHYQEFDSPDFKENMLYITSDLSLEITGNKKLPHFFFIPLPLGILAEFSEYHGTSANKNIIISQTKTKHKTNLAAFTLLAGVLSAFATFIILNRITDK